MTSPTTGTGQKTEPKMVLAFLWYGKVYPWYNVYSTPESALANSLHPLGLVKESDLD